MNLIALHDLHASNNVKHNRCPTQTTHEVETSERACVSSGHESGSSVPATVTKNFNKCLAVSRKPCTNAEILWNHMKSVCDPWELWAPWSTSLLFFETFTERSGIRMDAERDALNPNLTLLSITVLQGYRSWNTLIKRILVGSCWNGQNIYLVKLCFLLIKIAKQKAPHLSITLRMKKRKTNMGRTSSTSRFLWKH